MAVRLGSNKMGEHGNKCDLTWMMVMMQKDYTRHSHIYIYTEILNYFDYSSFIL